MTSRSRPCHVDGERGARCRPQLRVAAFDRQLDVLRIVIDAADDDQVLEPAGDEQLAVVQEAQVAGPQERPVAAVRQMRAGTCARVSSARFQ